VFWEHWWLALPTDAAFGLVEIAARIWPRAADRYAVIPALWRRRLEIAILVGVTFYAGFAAWRDQYHARITEHDARIKAESRVAEKPMHLTRSLAYDNIMPTTEYVNDKLVLTDYSGRLNNTGLDTIHLRVEQCNFYFDGNLILTASSEVWSYISPTQGIPLNLSTKISFPIPQDVSGIIMEMLVRYDTVPATGVRTSYRKVWYPITRFGDAKPSIMNGKIIEQREE